MKIQELGEVYLPFAGSFPKWLEQLVLAGRAETRSQEGHCVTHMDERDTSTGPSSTAFLAHW